MSDSKYDSTVDTLKHIKRVSQLLNEAAIELLKRANEHDDSKLHEPEKSLFDKFTPLLKDTEYGSDEYYKHLEGLKVALDHHYARNSHHPEHYPDGVEDMNLFDILEMFFDWKAASERHATGNIYTSIHKNKDRFNMGAMLARIFYNTAQYLNYEK